MGAVQLPADVPEPSATLAAFGLSGRVFDMVAVAGAWSNRVYRLDTDRGCYAVKELRNAWGDPRWRDWLQAAWAFEQAAWAAGVSMPKPVANPVDGGCVGWVEPHGGGSVVPVRLHEWIDGTAPGPGPVEVPVASWAGRTLAALHRTEVTPDDRGAFPVTSTATADRWTELTEVAHRAGASWAPLMHDVVPAVKVIADLSEAAGHHFDEEIMTHGDVDQKNLLIAPSGPVLCDWDLAAPLVPRRELAYVALSLAGWERVDIVHEVVREYRSAGGVDTRIREQDLGQPLMVDVDWIAFNVERSVGVRPAAPEEAARAGRLVPRLLTKLPHQVDIALLARELFTSSAR